MKLWSIVSSEVRLISEKYASGGWGGFFFFFISRRLKSNFSKPQNKFVQKNTARTHFDLTFPSATRHCCSWMIASGRCVGRFFTHVRWSVHACLRLHASDLTRRHLLSSLKSSRDTVGAHPLYLFVRKPDECNWQSYIIISQRLRFTPGAGMRGIVDSCRREDNWVN